VEVKTPPLVRMVEFHGHLGPYVVLGHRSGEVARELLESPGYFDMEAEVTSPLHTPQSCFIDGVHLGSGCTVGKRNLAVTEGERVGALFRSRGGKAVRIDLRPELPARIAEWIQMEGVEKTAHRVLDMAREEVFLVTRLYTKC
jgi:formylmethanofuran dehydrogenase subunit E